MHTAQHSTHTYTHMHTHTHTHKHTHLHIGARILQLHKQRIAHHRPRLAVYSDAVEKDELVGGRPFDVHLFIVARRARAAKIRRNLTQR